MHPALLSPAHWAEATDKKWTHTDHHLLLNEAIVDLVRGTLGVPILLVEIPVRHGKSEFLSHKTMAWHSARYPEQHRVLASASDRLATKWGRKARHSLREFGPTLAQVGVSDERAAANDWETTRGGSMLTAGVGGDVMGRDMHFGAIDDFLKNGEAALSPTIREKQWDFFQSTMFTRLEPGGCIVVFGTRWHPDDLIGCIKGESSLNQEPYPHKSIRLPALCDDPDNDPLGRKAGEALWPSRWPVGTPDEMVENAWGDKVVGLAMRRRITDDYWWNCTYQQTPVQHGKVIWPDEYFTHVLSGQWPGTFEASAMTMDPAEGTTQGSYSATVFCGISGGKLWFDAEIIRESVEKMIERGIDMMLDYHPTYLGCETNKHGSLVLTEWNRQVADRFLLPAGLEPITNSISKEARVMRWGGLLKNDQVRIRDTPGGRLLLRQLKGFGVSKELDGPDAGEMAFRLLGTGLGGTMPTASWIENFAG